MQAVLGQIGETGEDDDEHGENEQRCANGARLALQHIEQQAHGGRIAGQLEDPEEAQDTQKAQVEIDEKDKIEGQNGQEVDQRHGCQHVAQAS